MVSLKLGLSEIRDYRPILKKMLRRNVLFAIFAKDLLLKEART